MLGSRPPVREMHDGNGEGRPWMHSLAATADMAAVLARAAQAYWTRTRAVRKTSPTSGFKGAVTRRV